MIHTDVCCASVAELSPRPERCAHADGTAIEPKAGAEHVNKFPPVISMVERTSWAALPGSVNSVLVWGISLGLLRGKCRAFNSLEKVYVPATPANIAIQPLDDLLPGRTRVLPE
jgi:hypothetical protein